MKIKKPLQQQGSNMINADQAFLVVFTFIFVFTGWGLPVICAAMTAALYAFTRPPLLLSSEKLISSLLTGFCAWMSGTTALFSRMVFNCGGVRVGKYSRRKAATPAVTGE